MDNNTYHCAVFQCRYFVKIREIFDKYPIFQALSRQILLFVELKHFKGFQASALTQRTRLTGGLLLLDFNLTQRTCLTGGLLLLDFNLTGLTCLTGGLAAVGTELIARGAWFSAAASFLEI